MLLASLTDFAALKGHRVVRWLGSEEALAENPVVWRHDSVPYTQFGRIDIHLGSDLESDTVALLSQMEDGSDFHGLYLQQFEDPLSPEDAEEDGIFRTRELHELPVGLIERVEVRAESELKNLELFLWVGGVQLSFLAGEVWEDFRIRVPDESILVQVDGKRPPDRS